MSEQKVTCPECNKEYGIGDWPFCKGTGDHAHANFGYEPLEPYVDCELLPPSDPRCVYRGELGRKGVLIETRSDRQRLMRETGVQIGSNHPGGREI